MNKIFAALLAVVMAVGVVDARCIMAPVGGYGPAGSVGILPPPPIKPVIGSVGPLPQPTPDPPAASATVMQGPTAPPQNTLHGLVWGMYWSPFTKKLAYLDGFEPTGKNAKTVWG